MSTSANRGLVMAFGQMAFHEKRVQEAAEKYLPENYIQHNPQVPDGRDAFIEAVGGLFGESPDTQFDVKRVVAEGDLVVVHTHMRITPDDAGQAIVDFFRVEDDKIVEHWEVTQPVPEDSANDNTMF